MYFRYGLFDRPQPPRYMLTGALDSTIRLWDVSTGRCVRTFFGHVEGIWALAADTLRVVSGAEDRMVKVWDPRAGKCERTFTGHAGPVTCIGLSDSRMCTGSEDCEVRLYSFKCDRALPIVNVERDGMASGRKTADEWDIKLVQIYKLLLACLGFAAGRCADLPVPRCTDTLVLRFQRFTISQCA
jgi:WD40 repeat protein